METVGAGAVIAMVGLLAVVVGRAGARAGFTGAAGKAAAYGS